MKTAYTCEYKKIKRGFSASITNQPNLMQDKLGCGLKEVCHF